MRARERSWIVTNDVNSFRWPGSDVRVLDDGTPFYSEIPDWLFLRVRASVGTWAGRGMRVSHSVAWEYTLVHYVMMTNFVRIRLITEL
ncbi:hypothetical protein HMP06_3218 [Sphingomonas sp. HMP6]|nr:hypothetical protein HMP06_3218 [Sphingomonas sp. HMP6]